MTALTSMLGGIVGDKGKNSGENQSLTRSLSREHRDFTVGYCEKSSTKHIARMEGGRSTGFWQVGTYVLGEEREAVDAVLALLRSIYSGSRKLCGTDPRDEHHRQRKRPADDLQHALRSASRACEEWR